LITYRLICGEGHEFEGWFKSMAAFDEQADAGHLSCPVCGDTKIEKSIMAPAVKGSVTKADLAKIAEVKMKDLNANDIEAAIKIIAGSARSMGIEVKG